MPCCGVHYLCLFAALFLILSLFSSTNLSHNLGHTPPPPHSSGYCVSDTFICLWFALAVPRWDMLCWHLPWDGLDFIFSHVCNAFRLGIEVRSICAVASVAIQRST